MLRKVVCFMLLCLLTGELHADIGKWTAALPIEGYTDSLSYQAGEQIALHLSSQYEQVYLTIQRYGARRDTVWRGKVSNARSYPVPANASSHGCDWPVTLTIKVPDSWRSGYYEIFTGTPDPDNAKRWIDGRTLFFVVRSSHPGRDADILLQLPSNTYNAYNNWGGASLYPFNSRDGRQAHRVSFQRPLPSDAYNWEIPFIEWAESNGYRLDYAVNSDLEFHPELIKQYRLLLSVGHDEYWSSPMRDSLEGFIDRGGNVAFFSGNNITWQIRYEDGGREMVTWKERYRKDPLYRPDGPNPLLTTLWSHPLVNRPENRLSGAGMMFGGMHRSHGQLMDGTGAFTVQRPDHWVFAGTGLKEGDLFGAKDTIVGYETDGCEMTMANGRPVPTHRDGTPQGFEILATAPASWPDGDWSWFEGVPAGRMGNACLGLYSRPGGGTVFTASTTGWANGLRGHDEVVELITRNVLDRLGSKR